MQHHPMPAGSEHPRFRLVDEPLASDDEKMGDGSQSIAFRSYAALLYLHVRRVILGFAIQSD